MNDISAGALETFLLYARDAQNWSGTPWVSAGNIVATQSIGGYLTDLADKGYLTIEDSYGDKCIMFTDEGVTLATSHGIELY